MVRRAWALIKFLFGVLVWLFVGALPPEFVVWLRGWGDADERETHDAPIRYGKRRRFRRRAT